MQHRYALGIRLPVSYGLALVGGALVLYAFYPFRQALGRLGWGSLIGTALMGLWFWWEVPFAVKLVNLALLALIAGYVLGFGQDAFRAKYWGLIKPLWLGAIWWGAGIGVPLLMSWESFSLATWWFAHLKAWFIFYLALLSDARDALSDAKRGLLTLPMLRAWPFLRWGIVLTYGGLLAWGISKGYGSPFLLLLVPVMGVWPPNQDVDALLSLEGLFWLANFA